MREPRAGFDGFDFADDAAYLLQARLQQGFGIKGGCARQQFVKQDAQRIDVTARVYPQLAHLGLLGAHVSRRPNELLEGGE